MNPCLLRFVAVVVGAAAGMALSPTLIAAGLGAIGFGVAGPVAGSIAAWIQSGIGNVAAGSLFAAVQSLAMGGAILKIVTAIGASIGAAAGAACPNRMLMAAARWY